MWPSCWKCRERALRRVDRQVGEVRAAEPLQLRVQIGEVAPLQQRVVGEVDAGHDVLRAERHLLGLGEEVVDDAVEHEAPDDPDRHVLLGDDLRGVQDVEGELVGELVVEELQPELPLGEVALADGVPQVAPVEVRIGAVDLQRLVPDDRLQPLLGLPVELDERRLPVGVDEPERVDAEALHEPERPRDRPIGHRPHQHVRRLRHERCEVPEVVVGGLGLREPAVGLLLGRVDQVRELDRILDEEHRDVVADEVPVARLRVELDREPADVTREVAGALVAGHRREPHERRGALARALEQIGGGEVLQRLVVLEEAVRAVAASVHDALGDALVIEVEDLLAEVEVLQRGRPALADPQGVLVVADDHALLRRQARPSVTGDLVGLAAVAALHALIAKLDLVLALAVSRHSLSRYAFTSRTRDPSRRLPGPASSRTSDPGDRSATARSPAG